MMKVDVGWGQGGCLHICEQQIDNEDLAIQGISFPAPQGHAVNSFRRLWVPNGINNYWYASHNSPHHIQYVQNSLCNFDWTFPNGTETPCIASQFNNNRYSEGVFTNLNTNSDPFLDYCISLNLQKLACPNFGVSTHNMVIAMTKGLTNHILNQNIPIPSNPRTILGTIPFGSTSFTSIPVNLSYTPNLLDAYSQIWIYAEGLSGMTNATTVNDVHVTCTTRALTDIITNQVTDLNWSFSAENASTVSTFVSHNWTITDISNNRVVFTSTASNPNFTFLEEGTYEVCVDIVDNNGCCASICEEIIVECDDPVANFTIAGECPNFTFIANNLDENHTYSWVINGQQVGTNGVLPFSFTENGIFTIELFVTNECGDIARSTITLEVDCICEPHVRDFNMTLVCNNGVGNATFTILNGQPGDVFTWSFGDGTPNVTTSSVSTTHTYTNNGIFTITLVVTNRCGETQTITKTINVTCVPPSSLCARYLENGGFFIDGGAGPVNFAQYVIQNNVPNTTNWWFNNQIFVIRGTVVMDRNLTFIGCTFLFEGGASLELNNTSKSQNIVFSNSILQACDNVMWKGVKSINGNHRFVFGTTIQDAEYGIEVLNNGSVTCRNTKFYQNGVGIMFRANASHTIVGCNFSGERDRPLLSMYGGQQNYKGKAYAGVFFDNIVSGTVGVLNSNARNTFEWLYAGIITDKTNISVFGNDFKDMHFGNCNWNLRNKWDACSNIWIYGGSNHVISENNFTGGYQHGIWCTDMQNGLVNVSRNKAENLSTFFSSNYNFNTTFNIFENDRHYFLNGGISCYQGIFGAGDGGENIFNIHHNQFNSQTNNNFSYSSIGIYNEGSKFTSSIYNNSFDITKIKINATSSHISPIIWLSNFNNCNFNDNVIVSYASDKHYQVHLQGVRKFFANDNQLFNLSLNPSTAANGFRIIGGINDSKFYCNQTFATDTGFFFYGDYPVIDFKSNLMKNNLTGINVFRLFQGQADKGNLWVGANSLAKHENGGSLRWTVNPNQVAPASEPDGKFRPTTVDPAVWFRDVQNDAVHCFGPPNEENGDGPESKANLIINSLSNEEVTGDLQRWNLQNQMYELYSEFPHLLQSNDIYAQSYGEIPTEVHAYQHVTNEYHTILQLTPIEESNLNAVRDLIKNKAQIKDDLWAAIDNTPESAEASFDYPYLLAADLEVLKAQENQILSDIKARQISEMNALKSEVEYLPETEYFHNHMKDILKVKADLFCFGVDYVFQNHLQTLQSIASKCFVEYGKPVTDAIAILKLNGDFHDVNFDNCSSVEHRSQLSDNTNEIQIIYPNPSSDKIFIAQKYEAITELVIKSVDGSLSKNYQNIENGVDISDLSNGVYIVQLMNEGVLVKSTKFLKIK